jgi:hypothetical protein
LLDSGAVKYFYAATKQHATMEEMLIAVFSMWSVPRLYSEAGSNTSIVTLRVVGGDEQRVSNLRE